MNRPSRAGQPISDYEHALALRRLAKSWGLAGAGYAPEPIKGSQNPYWLGAKPADAAETLETANALIDNMERLIELL